MTDATIGHLTNVSVGGLFGRRQINFALDKSWPTVITGSNGSGKSTILKIIDGVGTGDWTRLAQLPFEEVRLEFEDGSVATVARDDDEMAFTLDGQEWRYPIQVGEQFGDLDLDDLAMEMARRIGPDRFEYRGGRYTRSELHRQLVSDHILELSGTEFDWVSRFVEEFPILFITDQRLVVTEDAVPGRMVRRTHRRSAVVDAKAEIREQISTALANYASRSQVLDRDFPHRVVEAMAMPQEVDRGRLSILMQDVSQERQELQSVGLLPKEIQPGPFQELPLDQPHVAPVIETFLLDAREKFSVLSDLKERLTLFTAFLNQHYRSKTVVTQPGEGFAIDVEGGREQSLHPTMLSSGEQQILVLAYEILFRAEPGTLVLIDEPELSLHVVWQDSFVDDVARMGSVRDLRFLLATHSPTLIGGREDLRRSLDPA